MFVRTAVAALLLVGSTAALSARPLLEHATPAPNSTMRHAPPRVVLSFNETLSPSGSDAVVRNASGGIVSSGKARVLDDLAAASTLLACMNASLRTTINLLRQQVAV